MDYDEDICADFGRRLRVLRTERGLTQESLGAAAGLERTYVSDAEAGTRNATLRTVAKLAKALGVKPSDLLVG